MVVWNEVYTKISDALVPGKVIAVQGTIDKRDDAVRATAQKVKVLQPDPTNGVDKPARAEVMGGGPTKMVLRFSPSATSAELQDVRQILASSPGMTAVQLILQRPGGETFCVEAGSDCRVAATPELKERLAQWL